VLTNGTGPKRSGGPTRAQIKKKAQLKKKKEKSGGFRPSYWWTGKSLNLHGGDTKKS